MLWRVLPRPLPSDQAQSTKSVRHGIGAKRSGRAAQKTEGVILILVCRSRRSSESVAMPHLLTDNLYKFAAVGGLAMLCVCGTQMLSTFRAEQSAVAHWNASWKPLIEKESQLADLANQQLGCAIQEAEAREQHRKLAASEQRKGTLASITQVQTENNHLEVVTARLDGDRNLLGFLVSQFTLTLVWAIPGGQIGGVASAWGFWHWHGRVQRPIDRLTEVHHEGLNNASHHCVGRRSADD